MSGEFRRRLSGPERVFLGDGSVNPTGANALSIADGFSTTSASFTLSRNKGNKKTVTMTATVHGTTQTLTVTLSS